MLNRHLYCDFIDNFRREFKKMVAFLKDLMYPINSEYTSGFLCLCGHKRAEPLRLWVSGNGPRIPTGISLSLRGFAV